ncbi:MAG: VWA domain-containing protein [Ilumatobacteraceae bacterium]
MRFAVEAYQNEYLPRGGTDVHAVLTVTATGDGADGGIARPSAIVLIIDSSGSMGWDNKLARAIEAAHAAIDQLRDGVMFAIVSGSHYASSVFPSTARGLVASTPGSRVAAKAAVAQLRATGGTAIGRWLDDARSRLAEHDGAIRQAILLTDGSDESETRDDLEAAVAACTGVFQCDCRGIGTDWRVDELRLVASTLLGTLDIVPRPDDMAGDFSAMIQRAMGKQAADVALRLWAPRHARVEFFKQVAPTLQDLTAHATAVDERTRDVPTGTWGDESRDYHLLVVVPPQEVGAEMLAARVSLIVDGAVASQSLVRAVWTDDLATSTRIDPQVAHYTGQAELASAIADGLAARADGDESTATTQLGRAAQLATETGHDATLRLLAGVVEIVDAGTGTVRLRRDVDRADEMALETRSTRTVRAKADG